jgi:hypothetical protein
MPIPVAPPSVDPNDHSRAELRAGATSRKRSNMSHGNDFPPDDLRGSADDRMRQLRALEPSGHLSAEWLRRQLDAALAAWSVDETTVDIDQEARTDY